MKRIALSIVLSSVLLGLGGLARGQEPAPDNTAVNSRDKIAGAMTPDQQSNSPTDVKLASEIRRAVVKDDSLSMLAHNVKIITANGSVTLRGPVQTAAEKTSIADKARALAGPDKVNDELEVKAQ